MRHVTFADRSDVIRFDAPDEIISAAARPAHDNETLGEMYPGAFRKFPCSMSIAGTPL